MQKQKYKKYSDISFQMLYFNEMSFMYFYNNSLTTNLFIKDKAFPVLNVNFIILHLKKSLSFMPMFSSTSCSKVLLIFIYSFHNIKHPFIQSKATIFVFQQYF